ncbi:unnamed protein product [Rhodiola kirilowii]
MEIKSSAEADVSGDSIRRRFLEFYASRGHKILPSSSFVPDDPTVLLTIAGMLQFKPIFLGKGIVTLFMGLLNGWQIFIDPREVPRAATAQKCIRTNDVENVGRTARHHTFFEMLGNFSFGDYFKKDAIKWAWELSTSEFGLPADRVWISVYEDDDEAYAIWHDEVGVPTERIKRMGAEDNFWTSGVTGPCSELYYDFHPERGYSDTDLGDDSRFIEFYNLVFMQFNKKDDGSLEPLKQQNIETGLGLERMARILQKVPNNYETDLIYPIIDAASKLANVSYALADENIKTKLKMELSRPTLADDMWLGDLSVELSVWVVPVLSGKDAFLLYDTYGYPVEITVEVAEEGGVSVYMEGFDVEMENQRRQSQAAHNAVKLEVEDGANFAENISDTEFLGYDTLNTKAVVEALLVNGRPVIQVSEGSEVDILLNRTPFYAESGGQIGDQGFLYLSETKSSLNAVVEIKDVKKSMGNIFVHKGIIKEGVLEVGKEVEAAVDAILRQRAKVHHTATHLLQAALKEVIGQERNITSWFTGLINEWIGDATDLRSKVMPIAEAKNAGAIAMFGEKYGEEVRVVEVPGGAGCCFWSSVAGDAFIEYVNGRDVYLRQLCSTLKVKAEEVTTRVDNLLEELRTLRNEVADIRAKAAVYKASTITSKALVIGNSKQISPGVVSLGLQAGKFLGPIAKLCGGGRPNFAQAGGRKPEKLLEGLGNARDELIAILSQKAS